MGIVQVAIVIEGLSVYHVTVTGYASVIITLTGTDVRSVKKATIISQAVKVIFTTIIIQIHY